VNPLHHCITPNSSGGIPWDTGYHRRKFELISRVLLSEEMLGLFRDNGALPAGYGVGIDERCIEYPWFFSRLPSGSMRLLDAGSVCNHPEIIRHPRLQEKEIHILSLAPEDYCFWKQGISYLFADLRRIPILDEFYDSIVSISTLEHVGMDNFLYSGNKNHQEHETLAFIDAARELWRVLAPGGGLFITLPFGRKTNLVIAQQFDWAMVLQLIEGLGPHDAHYSFYRYGPEGWQIASRAACEDAVYVPWVIEFFRHPHDPRFLSALPVEKDLAAAARAVVCLELRKPGV